MFECLGDSDFLAKLHCIRQAFQVNCKEWFVCLVKPKVHVIETDYYCLCKHFYNVICIYVISCCFHVFVLVK